MLEHCPECKDENGVCTGKITRTFKNWKGVEALKKIARQETVLIDGIRVPMRLSNQHIDEAKQALKQAGIEP
jgi:fumarylacetoacetate (FAA) hydrolase family protein